MSEPTLVFTENGAVVCNFGIHAGREATPAEVERLGEALLAYAAEVEILCEQRYTFDREHRASVYQVRVRAPEGSAEALAPAIEAWARECIAERRLMTP